MATLVSVAVWLENMKHNCLIAAKSPVNKTHDKNIGYCPPNKQHKWLFLRSTALLLHAHKNTFFYRYNIIEVGKTVADV